MSGSNPGRRPSIWIHPYADRHRRRRLRRPPDTPPFGLQIHWSSNQLWGCRPRPLLSRPVQKCSRSCCLLCVFVPRDLLMTYMVFSDVVKKGGRDRGDRPRKSRWVLYINFLPIARITVAFSARPDLDQCWISRAVNPFWFMSICTFTRKRILRELASEVRPKA